MHRPPLNLGILAHIDAGKTSLTERLLFDHGAIGRLGSVDAGSTTTDHGVIERQRGITIRSAVASFVAGDLQINIVDTPGHPDFIAEVERALSVLDAAILVVSAVEGVQAQTRVLFRSLRDLGVPIALFINKIDRSGADEERVVAQIRRRLTPRIARLTAASMLGSSAAQVVWRELNAPGVARELVETLADRDDELLARVVDDVGIPAREVRANLVRQACAGQIHPVFSGSAISGAGVAELVAGIRCLFGPLVAESPSTTTEDELSGVVFAIERGANGEKVAWLRLFAGEVRERESLTFRRPQRGGPDLDVRGRVTRLDVAGHPAARRLLAGDIGRLSGLSQVRIGDRLGAGHISGPAVLAQPRLESVVWSKDAARQGDLHAALSLLADEDPLIGTRVTGDGATAVLLHGPVQREVLQERLARDFALDAKFDPIQPVLRQRPLRAGQALYEFDHQPATARILWATIGLRVEPGPLDSGITYVRDVEWGAVPRAFHLATEEAVLQALRHGRSGWEVTDCVITIVRFGYLQPMSVAADFRQVARLVLYEALDRAGTRLFEPCQRIEVQAPADAVGGVLAKLSALEAEVAEVAETPGPEPFWTVHAVVPVRTMQELTLAVPGLSRGEGVVFTRPGPDRPVRSS